MRIVVDTNIFVSLLIRPGDTFLALIDIIDRGATVLYSAETLTELVDVLRRRKFTKHTTPQEVAALVKWIADEGELVAVEEQVMGSRDIKDNKFLSLAVAGRADYLISGDKDLLALGRIGAVPILSPAHFLAAVNH
jgi:putative PIN family toxin of toxin-antitoxin system